MIRRNALAALSAVAAPLLVGVASRGAQAQAAGLSAAQYRRETLNLGTLAKETSLLAADRAEDSEVERFARIEAEEQTTVARVLTGQRNPPPAPLTRAQQQIVARLRALRGEAFDREYVLVQIAGHEALRRVQQGYLRTTTEGRLADIAELVLDRVEEHLSDLEVLQERVAD